MKSLLKRALMRQTVIRFSDAAMTAVSIASERSAPNETGGLLLGWWESGTIVVADAVEVVDTKATGTSWTRRETPAQATLNRFLAHRANDPLGYVGDWHSHPDLVGASQTDLASLCRASLQFEQPLALVVRLPDGSADVRAAGKGKLLAAHIAN